MTYRLLVAAALLSFAAAVPAPNSNDGAGADLPPIIFVPGTTESKIELELDYPIDLEVWCIQKHDWEVMWPSDGFFNRTNHNPLEALCWENWFNPKYDAKTNTWGDREGVRSRTIDFGKFSSVEQGQFLATGWTQNGWTLGKNLFAAPWDWRLASPSFGSFYPNLKALVEQVHNQTKQKVSFWAVSGGCQSALAFLHRQTQAWKDEHIAKVAFVSPVWSGTVTSAGTAIAGTNLYPSQPATKQLLKMFEYLGHFPQCLWLTPRAGTDNYTWPESETIVETPDRGYSASELGQALTDVGLKHIAEELAALIVEPDLAKFEAPGVDSLIIYGYEVPTPTRYHWNTSFAGKWPGAASSTEYGSGDGLVPARSSVRSATWQDAQSKLNKQLMHRAFFNQSHAMCTFPFASAGGDPVCFHQVTSWIVNNTIPPSL